MYIEGLNDSCLAMNVHVSHWEISGRDVWRLGESFSKTLVFAQAVMRRRDNIQAEFEVKSDTLASRKSDLDAVSVTRSPSSLCGLCLLVRGTMGSTSRASLRGCSIHRCCSVPLSLFQRFVRDVVEIFSVSQRKTPPVFFFFFLSAWVVFTYGVSVCIRFCSHPKPNLDFSVHFALDPPPHGGSSLLQWAQKLFVLYCVWMQHPSAGDLEWWKVKCQTDWILFIPLCC